MKKFPERLKEAMAFRNYRQIDLAKKTRIAKGTISNYLSGKYEPKPVNAMLIADALSVNLPWLLGNDDVPMEIQEYTDYYVPPNGDGYLQIDYQEGFEKDFTYEKWKGLYGKIMSLPETTRLEVLEYLSLVITLNDAKAKLENKYGNK